MAGNFRGDESRPQTSEPSTESRKRSNHWIWAGRRPANVNNQPAIIAPSLCYGWYGSKCLPNYPAGVLQMSKRLAISSCVREGAIPIHLHVSPFSQGKVDFHWIFMGFYWCLWIFPGFPYIFRCPKKKGVSPAGPPSLRPKTFALLGSPLRARCCHRSAASWLLATGAPSGTFNHQFNE